MTDSLEQVVAKHPFADYQTWWPVGEHFISFMAQAIVSEWGALNAADGKLDAVRDYAAHYHEVVYGRSMRSGLVADFASAEPELAYESGEFDALSYAFYRAAFEQIAEQSDDPITERRRFTVRVGARFFEQVQAHLQLELPAMLDREADFGQLRAAIERVGAFLVEQGYLRDHFAFVYDVDGTHGGRVLQQQAEDFLPALYDNKLAFALYEMGYPIILPSAVYLYETLGEAQHHSSRTIEELFKRVGYIAAEVDDFDPRDYASDHVVELWEIRPTD